MDGVASVPQTSALIKRKARCDATDDDGLLDPLARLELSLRFETPEHESVVDSDEDEWQCKRRRISRQASVHVLQACSSLFEGVARIQDSFAEFSGRPCNSPVPWDSAPSPVSGEALSLQILLDQFDSLLDAFKICARKSPVPEELSDVLAMFGV
eukprot:CAMPEP_0196659954 /NCGR_PEP_ID=MMETSP1086-20130531/37451_1 /TAXON_ID=77921 /ORGANISM="Cyanoptyche  gloeocystis , Strain SAG4.97" /LENGTH=154 /DNA_ID=CAMNT_0041994147 /DNA_START=202 /DNA_END=667 /DNA_ORIENTATION=-